jgi:hypothetical protein
MLDVKPVGEFGSKAWCEACAAAGVEMLKEADLPADLEWGFSEIYTLPPARLLSDERAMSAYYFMVKDGEVSGGDGAPDACLALPGFHVKIQWAAICKQSQSLYGREGQKQRSAEEKILFKELEDHAGRPNPLGLGDWSNSVWPPSIVEALSKGSEEGGGLHNIAANLQIASPEFEELPATEMGVPIFSKMTEAQKAGFLDLLGLS